ncbi:hypothetical protein [Nocardia wallacei]|uniref:hypothetical protein n=1 Tax=Nocardia wallacei TaxID=480035 RepID=UPI002458DE9A|nr:hypothetical protein [Nocardia wallacei]
MRPRARGAATTADDYGLLFPVATTATEDAAHYIRDMLRASGIRATTARSQMRSGCLRVLVFPEDAACAYDLICKYTTE